MLRIKSISGDTDFSETLPSLAAYRIAGAGERVAVSIQCEAVEDDPLLPDVRLSGTLNWNDGSQPTVYTSLTGTLSLDESKAMSAGDYVVSVQVENIRAPIHDVVRANFPVAVIQSSSPAPAQKLIYGPILPRDSGSPNVDDWDFDTASDGLILESSVRMLLLTAKGERIMQPEYGTNIRRILFDMNIKGVESAIQEEIVSALSAWEPRLSLNSISVVRKSDRSVIVSCAFLSKLNNNGFETSIEFSK